VANNILITPGSASIQFSGSAANTIRLQVEDSGSIAFYGNSGSLFGITDNLSGSLMSVNDISGLPILEVFSDDRVVAGTFNTNTLVVTGSRIGLGKGAPTALLDISGSVFLSGSLVVSTNSSVTASNVNLVGLSNTTNANSVLVLETSTGKIFTTSSVGSPFPYTGTAVISGSLNVTGSATVANLLGIGTTAPNYKLDIISGSIRLLNNYGILFNDNAGTAESVISLGTSNNLSLTSPTLGGSIIYTTRNTSAAHQFLIGAVEKFRVNSTGVGIGKTAPSTILDVSGSMLLTGSLNVSGSITASLFGSASYATTASYALSATATLPAGVVSSSQQINTGSFTGSFIGIHSGSLFGTASWANNAISASFAPAIFPFSGSAVITGSLFVSGAVNVSGTLTASSGSIPQLNTFNLNVGTDVFGTPTYGFGKLNFFDNTVYLERAFASGLGLLNIRSTIIDIGPGPAANSGIFVDGDATAIQFYMPAYANSGITVTGIATATTVNATSYTSSITNGVGYFGTASRAVSSSYILPSGLPAGTVSSSTQFTSLTAPFTGSFTGSFKGDGTGLTGITAVAAPPAGTVSSSAQVTASIVGATIAPSILSASIITSSNVQLLNLASTTNANSVLVLETATNRIFTTSSVTTPTFPYTGNAIITGSLLLSGSVIVVGNMTYYGLTISGSLLSRNLGHSLAQSRGYDLP